MKYAAIDVGLKRIGVAVSDGKVIFPQHAILRKNRNQAARDVDAFLKEWDVDTLVVGVPRGGESEAEMTRRIEHFVSLLEFDGAAVYQDEYGTSAEAKERMHGDIRQKRDGRIDSIAAQIILERYLERCTPDS